MTQLFLMLGALLLLVCALLTLPALRCRQWQQAAGAAMFVTLVSAGLYALLGSPRVVSPAEMHNAMIEMLDEKITHYSELVKKEPENLEAWLFLAQAFSDAGDHKAAANGFKQAVLVSKGDPRIIMAYAEALILADGGVVGEQAKKSIDVALMIDPALPIARYYQAVWLLQEERNEEAMEMMKALYAELPEDSKLKQRMKAEIGR